MWYTVLCNFISEGVLNMKKKNCAIFEIVCYVAAVLLAIVAVYMTYENIAYISEYAAAYGATFADLGGQAIQSVLSAAVPYFTYAFVVFGMGRIYHQVAAPKCEAVEAVEVVEAEAPAAFIEAPAEAAEPVVEPAEEAPVAEPCCECCESCEAPAAEAVEEPKED